MAIHTSLILKVVLSLLSWKLVISSKQPNIIFILADDLGWDDVSFHGSHQIPTPNIDELAYSGVLLHNYYVQPVCTPTRGALLTGRYPMHLGLQHFVITPNEPVGLPLNETTLPTYLKKLGYSTHMVGKWHLGFFAKEYTPTYRGFDSHYGYFLGHQDYYTHNALWNNQWGFDLRHNMDLQRSTFGEYGPELFTTQAEKLIYDHDHKKPLFLYFAHQAVHYGNSGPNGTLLEAPYKYTSRFPHIADHQRRIYAGMVSALDDSVGNITRALKKSGLYNNSIIVFSTDNGGPHECEAFNTPLRGTKNTLWEGGIRGAAFIHSVLLEKPKRVCEGMMHVVDWLPTMYHVAGGNLSDLHNLDGFNMWDTLSSGVSSPRTEILHNIDPITQTAALRVGNLKVIVGENKSDWFVPPQITFGKNGTNLTKQFGSDHRGIIVHCSSVPPVAYKNCDPKQKPCLYNIKNDPCEYYNLADEYPDVLQSLLYKLNDYNSTSVTPWVIPPDPRSNPSLHNDTWSPWIDLADIAPDFEYR
ncbi:arylsulfatase I-like [Saccoglossus kowalevskii]|uniref:Arylsulfatase B-like n=1 Tax=Saccoglossus kowalevskii TaxID=10224 RepID=A0ABM0H024_SACKO|nr:PREDICTED: arylsulfatase B-like [Saccoglossus kowalevskii]